MVLSLRPQIWSERSERERARDPYKRYSKRGTWGVDVEDESGTKKFYAALDVRSQDTFGDLRIEVEKESDEEDRIGQYVRTLGVGDSVSVRGPRRPKDYPTRKGLLEFRRKPQS